MSFEDVELYLRERKYGPKVKHNIKKTIRRKSKAFLISPNGKLLYRGLRDADGGDAAAETSGGEGDEDAAVSVAKCREVVFTKEQQEKIVAELHSGPKGHYGRDRTREKVLAMYYWDSMTREIDSYVKNCKVCQESPRVAWKNKPQRKKEVDHTEEEIPMVVSGQEISLEVCVDSVQSAIAAFNGGAARVELCSGLSEGGLTPSLGLLQVIKKQCPNLPVFVLIRPRGGDFIYTPLEFEVMMQDIKLMTVNGADGFVFGILKKDGDVDKKRCKELLDLCQPFPTTFHRAFDMCRRPFVALEDIISLGFRRLLTSGQDSSVLEGLPLIAQLVKKANGRISVMPGGGITERNLKRILEGSNVTEYHCSARCAQQSKAKYRNHVVSMSAALKPPEFTLKVADENLIKRLGKMIVMK